MDFKNLLQTCQANILPRMLEDFADFLGVSANSLKALRVGAYPPNIWIFPERNNEGKVIGLLKRHPDGKKTMVENSQRGLIFPINSNYKVKNEVNLLQEFDRVSSIKTTCPICNKPDWCLISKDRSKAICPRIEEGSIKRVGDAGWLHYITEDERPKRSLDRGILPSTDLPIIVVEGATDVLAAWDLGFIAVGRPAALSGIEQLCKLLKGESVIIVGENDESGVGKLGMETVFKKLVKVCKKVGKLLPPPQFKDLRNWYRHGLVTNEFLDYISEHVDYKADANFLPDPAPLEIANQFLRETGLNEKGQLILRHHRGDWWRYTGSYYKLVEQDLLHQELYHYLEKKYFFTKDKKPTPYNPDLNKIRKIEHAMLASAQVKNGENTDEPFVIEGEPTEIEFDRNECVVFKNGILNVKTNKLTPLSPEFFITSTIPYDYNPDADCPLWKRTLPQWFDDKEAEMLLQEWFGYNLLATNHLEALMFLFGQPGSGKSTVTRVLAELLGPERCIALEFRDLAYTFGMEQIVGKYAAIFSEDQTATKSDSSLVLQMIKRLTGRNRINIRRKFKLSFTTEPFVRLTYECDVLPRFVDSPRALQRRINILYFPRSFKDSPDTTLKDRLVKEVQGIANWALEGLRRLIENKKFTHPLSSKDTEKEFLLMTCPMAAMIDDCCDFSDSKAITPKDQLYDLHRAWFKENGYHLYSRVWFFRMFLSTFPNIKEVKPLIQGRQVRCYKGIKIMPQAYERYLGKPS